MRRKHLGSVVLALIGVGVLSWLVLNLIHVGAPQQTSAVSTRAKIPTRQSASQSTSPAVLAAAAEEAAETSEPEPTSDPDTSADAEEKRVDDFDALTDKWMEPAKGEVSMAEVDRFVAQFKGLPPDRKDECLHRAMNLVPDENVMLLAGILLDKSIEKEYVELVFNDVLNRDEDVKKPILNLIFKDKTHPCWTDVAWILDVTGELPAKK